MIKIQVFLIVFISTFQWGTTQHVEIQGHAKVTEMINDNSIDEMVVRKPDGTLATRSAQSLPTSFQDTARNLNTDFELAKHMCDCGTDLPPYLIESLLDAGYSNQDLLNAGVPVSNISQTFTVSDLDGNIYDILTIGTQKWLKQNLRVKQFNDGTAIDLKLNNIDWENTVADEAPAYTYPNGDSTLVNQYGYSYTGYTTQSIYNDGKNVCPAGWIVPARSDMDTLISYLEPGSDSYSNSAGSFLKTIGTTDWIAPNVGANNLFEFDGLPAGYRISNGDYIDYGIIAAFNTTHVLGGGSATYYYKLTNNDIVFKRQLSSVEGAGASIRCIKE